MKIHGGHSHAKAAYMLIPFPHRVPNDDLGTISDWMIDSDTLLRTQAIRRRAEESERRLADKRISVPKLDWQPTTQNGNCKMGRLFGSETEGADRRRLRIG